MIFLISVHLSISSSEEQTGSPPYSGGIKTPFKPSPSVLLLFALHLNTSIIICLLLFSSNELDRVPDKEISSLGSIQ
jgi:hypothetical protein